MSLKFVAVGDVAPDRDEPATIFDHVRTRLTAADLGYCQLEVNLTTRGERLPQARHTMRGKPEIADALVETGLQVVSFAGNHTMDWGVTGMADTLHNLDRAGALQVGAGMDIVAARKPVIVERNGLRVGFLSVNSILPQNYWADENKPGCAPMRGHTIYEQIEHDQPGTPCRIHTFPNREDLADLVTSIKAVRGEVDFLVLAHHAGIHFVPAVVPDYQRDVARAAIDAGVDMVLGCHAHILKGIEFYRDKPIIHSLANFALDLKMTEAHAKSKGFREIQKLNPDWVPDLTSSYNFPPDSAMSFAVEAVIDGGELTDLALVPVFIERDANPRFVAPEDPNFARILTYLRDITEAAGFETDYQPDGDVIRPSQRR